MIFSSILDKLLNFKNFKRAKLEQKPNLCAEFFEKGFGNYKDNEQKINDLIIKMNKAYKMSDNITKPPVINMVKGNEKENRITSQNKALKIVEHCFTSYTKSLDLIPNLVKVGIKQVPRQIQHILCPDVERMSEEQMKKFNSDLIDPEHPIIISTIRNNIKRFNEFCNKLAFAKTDDEYLDICKDDLNLFFAIGELQWSDSYKNDFKDIYGVDLPNDVIEEWKKFTAKGVDLGTYCNRIGIMMDGYNCVLENLEDSKKIINWLYQNEDEIVKLSDDNLKEMLDFIPLDPIPEEYIEKHGINFNVLSYYGDSDSFHEKIFDEGLIGTNLGILNEENKIANPIYKNGNGNIITKEEACEILYNKGYVDLYNGDLFEQSVRLEGDLLVISKPKEIDPFLLNSVNGFYPDSFKKSLNNMKAMIEKGNPWYMKARNIIMPNDYQQISNIIDDLSNMKQFDSKKAIEKLNKVAVLTDKYLTRKINPSEKTDLTDKRIEAMTYVHDLVKFSLSHHNHITKEFDDIEKQNKLKAKQTVKNEPLPDVLFFDGQEIDLDFEVSNDKQPNLENQL